MSKTKTNEFHPDEIKNSKRIQKSATPKQDLSWYIKWTASCFILASMSIRGIEGLQDYDLILSTCGVFGWLIVSFIWQDRALIIVNGVGLMFLIKNLIINLI